MIIGQRAGRTVKTNARRRHRRSRPTEINDRASRCGREAFSAAKFMRSVRERMPVYVCVYVCVPLSIYGHY